MCVYVHVYIHTHRGVAGKLFPERNGEQPQLTVLGRITLCIHRHVYIYIYIYIYVYTWICIGIPKYT